MKVILAGEEIEMSTKYIYLKKVEEEVGSIFGYSDKCLKKTITLMDIVDIYYYLQQGAAYSQEKIYDKVIADGLMTHINYVAELFLPLVIGNSTIAELEKEAEKKLEGQ